MGRCSSRNTRCLRNDYNNQQPFSSTRTTDTDIMLQNMHISNQSLFSERNAGMTSHRWWCLVLLDLLLVEGEELALQRLEAVLHLHHHHRVVVQLVFMLLLLSAQLLLPGKQQKQQRSTAMCTWCIQDSLTYAIISNVLYKTLCTCTWIKYNYNGIQWCACTTCKLYMHVHVRVQCTCTCTCTCTFDKVRTCTYTRIITALV